ncbi:putative GCN5-related N-acetyltransferase [Erwinia phage vB_EamM_Caitlin]|uniref:putative GCN5-related N-acetyltransferase n=1 Tax=Erwinia phage vB_EamM_Caitlin TaxID=1883379 RepID=UPI00081CE242|nr:putative GCN5-related N-acetyltransferase [Erwinia phage vB_EamM_Caitlin]ANZ48410.1 putative GCN5-related N-acetyltransferase [Erwinia phage vB_EamM_Caitlin]
MYSIARVFWGSDKARKLRELLQPGSDSGRRLDAFLKNKAINVYALMCNHEFGGYFATSSVPGDKTLACHHISQLKRDAVRPTTVQLLLDHTGTSNIMMMAETPEKVKCLEALGFILIENNWSAQTALYANLEIDKRVQDISGLPVELVDADDLQCLNVILSCAILKEGEYDPLQRYILDTIRPDQVLERARTGQYRTLVWREAGVIKGMVQLEYTVWGGVSLTGMGVHPSCQNQRIGRNLVAAAMKLASQSHDEISATTFAGNLEAEHLLGRVLRYTNLPGSYGMAFNEGAVSWVRPKRSLKKADMVHGPLLTD